MPDTPARSDPKGHRQGLSGWSILAIIGHLIPAAALCLGLFVLLRQLSSADFSLMTLERILLDLAVFLLAMGVWIYASILWFRKHRYYPLVNAALLFVVLGYSNLRQLLNKMAAGVPITSDDITMTIFTLLLIVVFLSCWVFSKHVKNTFVN
jgi:hypothetical protein